MSIVNSKLKGTPQSQKEHLAECVKLLLLWVAASDGQLDESELEFAASHFPDQAGRMTTEDVLTDIRNADLKSIEAAIRSVAGESRELRTAFLDLAISMSMADRRIAITENHILRFYADALYLGISVLERRFQTISGTAFSEPGDPGDPSWWDEVTGEGLLAGATTGSPSGLRMTLEQARSVLGVNLNATSEEIESAYENLAAIFHVDRVEAMGEAAVSVAREKFRRVQEAAKLLGESCTQ
jgi:DnaJ-domain-containing protein 1